MKILYLVPKINAEGGLERVLSLKANYLVENFKHDVSILTQNNGNTSLFFPLNTKINLFDIDLSGNRLQFVAKYIKEVSRVVKLVNPDIIIVADSIPKALLISLSAKNRRIIYECHNSIFVELSHKNRNFVSNWIPKFNYWFNRFGAKRMQEFVALSKESLLEWNIPNGKIIPNPIWLQTERVSDLYSKKILIISRHSYEKGLDRFFEIWKLVSPNYPDWQVEIYGKTSDQYNFKEVVNQLGISDSVDFFEPVKDIEQKYLDASIYVMTSRYEAFPMVLLEAMACGLPTIAYDCPCGPRAIITDNENGFLIQDGNQSAFVIALQKLIESKELREKMGTTAKKYSKKYDIDLIMNQWNSLITSKTTN